MVDAATPAAAHHNRNRRGIAVGEGHHHACRQPATLHEATPRIAPLRCSGILFCADAIGGIGISRLACKHNASATSTPGADAHRRIPRRRAARLCALAGLAQAFSIKLRRRAAGVHQRARTLHGLSYRTSRITTAALCCARISGGTVNVRR